MTWGTRELRREGRRGRNTGIDASRLRRWRILTFALLAVPLIVLALLAGKFITMSITQKDAVAAFQASDFNETGARASDLMTSNYFEPYLPHFTRGTAMLKNGDARGAQQELENSLTLWTDGSDLNQPPHAECKIRNNLAIAMTMNADERSGERTKSDLLGEAEEVLAPCMPGGESEDSNEDQSSTGQTGEEIERRKSEAHNEESGRDSNETNGGSGDGSGPDDGGSEGGDQGEDQGSTGDQEDAEKSGSQHEGDSDDPAEAERQRELDERNRDNSEGSEDSSDPSHDGGTKPW